VKTVTSLPSLIFLGRELRRAREAAGMSQEQLAEAVNYVPSFISMVETARRVPKKEFTDACDKTLNTDGNLTRILIELVIRDGTPEWFRPWIEIEREATSIRSFGPLVVHGLMQTPDYARAVLDARAETDERLEQLVTARLERQEILTRDEPPTLVAITDESALRRPVGGPDVMRGQLEHLVELSARRNILLQVVPLSSGGHAGLAGAFAIADLGGMNEVAYLETALSGQVIDAGDQVAKVVWLWESLRAEALQAKQSIEFIKEVAKSWT